MFLSAGLLDDTRNITGLTGTTIIVSVLGGDRLNFRLAVSFVAVIVVESMVRVVPSVVPLMTGQCLGTGPCHF